MVSHGIGPVEDLLVHGLTLGEFLVKLGKIGFGLTSGDMDRLATLELDTHGGGSDWSRVEFTFFQVTVDVLRDRNMIDGARSINIATVTGKLRMMVWVNSTGTMEVVIVDKSDIVA